MERLIFEEIPAERFPWRMEDCNLHSFLTGFSAAVKECRSGKLKGMFERYFPKKSYLRRMLRELVDLCEERKEEVSDEIYQFYDLVMDYYGELSDDGYCFLTFFVNHSDCSRHCEQMDLDSESQLRLNNAEVMGCKESHFTIHLKCSNLSISHGTTGMSLWPAALVLCDFFSKFDIDSFDFAIELGAGTGLCSLVLGKLLQSQGSRPKCHSILLTDCNEEVLDLAKENIQCNNLNDSCKALLFDWCDSNILDLIQRYFEEDRNDFIANRHGESSTDSHKDFITNSPLIFASDIIYDTDILHSLVGQVEIFLNRFPNGRILLSATVRNEQTWASFMKMLDKFSISFIPLSFPRYFSEFIDISNVKMFWISLRSAPEVHLSAS